MLIDANKKRNVDFILQQDFKNPVPIEVGRGRKDKKQITHAINNYGADYGIIISDTITNIEKEDNIIYIPPNIFIFIIIIIIFEYICFISYILKIFNTG